MSRISTLRRHPKRTLVGLAAVLAAVAVAVGSGADFTSTSSNAANTFTAGILSHSNSASGNAFAATPVNLSAIKPGFGMSGASVDTTGGSADNYGQVKLTNNGSGTEDIGPTAAAVVSNAGSNSTACGGTCSALSGALKVLIKRGTTTVYDDTVAKLDGNSFETAQSVAKGSSVTYDMYFYLPSGTGNAYQGGDAQVTFNWAAS